MHMNVFLAIVCFCCLRGAPGRARARHLQRVGTGLNAAGSRAARSPRCTAVSRHIATRRLMTARQGTHAAHNSARGSVRRLRATVARSKAGRWGSMIARDLPGAAASAHRNDRSVLSFFGAQKTGSRLPENHRECTDRLNWAAEPLRRAFSDLCDCVPPVPLVRVRRPRDGADRADHRPQPQHRQPPARLTA